MVFKLEIVKTFISKLIPGLLWIALVCSSAIKLNFTYELCFYKLRNGFSLFISNLLLASITNVTQIAVRSARRNVSTLSSVLWIAKLKRTH